MNKATIREHDKLIREGRRIGILKPLGMTDKYFKIINAKKVENGISRIEVTESGSILPNKYLLWPRPFNKISEKDL